MTHNLYVFICIKVVGHTLSQLGQITSSLIKQDLLSLEVWLTSIYDYKEKIILDPASGPLGQGTNLTIQEIDWCGCH